MSAGTVQDNAYIHEPIGSVLAKTALPLVFVMGMNGLLVVVDAVCLGFFVGADALAAVTLMFPAIMIITALSTIIARGTSSLLTSYFSDNKIEEARAVFAGAHGLALAVCAVLILMVFMFGQPLTHLAASDAVSLAGMGHTYLLISVIFSPVLFVLSINSDALKNEGKIELMVSMSLLVALANIVFNVLLIGGMGLGVAGSALGTVFAQIMALGIILAFRMTAETMLHPTALLRYNLLTGWHHIVALGAPRGLNKLGIAAVCAAIILALQWAQPTDYETTVAAFGIAKRVIAFVFLPLLGFCFAVQSVIGNNYAAQLWKRSDTALRLAIVTALTYCTLVQVLLNWNADLIGLLFTDDMAVVTEVQQIVLITTALLFASGPLLIITTYFRTIGDVDHAALLSLVKPYGFSLPLIFILPIIFGEVGIWLSVPVAEVLLVVLTVSVLSDTAKTRSLGWGLFKASLQQQA